MSEGVKRRPGVLLGSSSIFPTRPPPVARAGQSGHVKGDALAPRTGRERTFCSPSSLSFTHSVLATRRAFTRPSAHLRGSGPGERGRAALCPPAPLPGAAGPRQASAAGRGRGEVCGRRGAGVRRRGRKEEGNSRSQGTRAERGPREHRYKRQVCEAGAEAGAAVSQPPAADLAPVTAHSSSLKRVTFSSGRLLCSGGIHGRSDRHPRARAQSACVQHSREADYDAGGGNDPARLCPRDRRTSDRSQASSVGKR